MGPQKLKIAAAGLGRMGKRHAINFLNRTPRAELVAAFSPDPAEIEWAKVHLEPYGVILYTDYDQMIQLPGLQAVVIGTATSVHAEESIKAMEKNLHVLCEKPLSINIDIVSLCRMTATIFQSTTTYLFETVQTSCRSSRKATSSQGYVWLLSPVRRLLPRRVQKDRTRHDRPPINPPQPNVRQT